MTTFYFIRHAVHLLGGERIAGRKPDVHLSPQGHADAARLATRLAGVPLDALHCSPITRTRETAAPIGARFGLEVQLCEAIQEIHYGDWTGAALDDLRPLEKWRQWNSFRSGTRVPGGETMLEIQARIVAQLQLWREEHRGGHVALVSHGDVIKAALTYCLGAPLDLMNRLEISPTSVSVVKIADYGPWVLAVNHLGALEELPLR